MSADKPIDFDEDLPFRDRTAAVNLFPAERRIVDHLLAIPAYELGIMTSSDLSEHSGASRSSIDRLSRKLGYPGLKEMRKALLLQEARQAGFTRREGGAERAPFRRLVAAQCDDGMTGLAAHFADTPGNCGGWRLCASTVESRIAYSA